MKPEEIAQWVISNRYPKSELDKVSDLEMYNFIVDKTAELIGPEIDLDLLAVENEKKNQRIRELKNGLHELYEAIDSCIELTPELLQKTKQLLNQKP